MSTEISTVNYSETELALAELRTKYAVTVFDVTNGKGMAAAKEARAELRGCRVRLEEARKAKKADALEYGRKVDSAAKALLAELEALEDPIDAQIKSEEQRKEREKAEREQKEREAVEERNRRFDEIRSQPLQAVNATAAEIIALIAKAGEIDCSEFDPQYRDAAKYEAGLAVLSLRAALDRRNAEDARAEQTRKDLAELEVLRAQQAETQRKADAEAQAARDAQEREAAAKRAQEAEDARVERERIAAEQKAASDRIAAEQKKLAEQRAQLDADKKAAAKKARADSIASATIYDAAAEASAFLKAKGFGSELVVEKLDAALSKRIQVAA